MTRAVRPYCDAARRVTRDVRAGVPRRRREDAMHRLLPGADRAERARFVRHYVEMVLAMFAGMLVLGLAVSAFCTAIGHGTLLDDHVGVRAPIMATNMTVGMTVWM